MITATGLELRAGPRLLLGEATFRIAAGRPGRPGRAQRCRQDDADPGAVGRDAAGGGHGHPLGRGRLPAAGPAHRRPATCWPATASCPPAGWTRWSAGCAAPRARWPAPTPRPTSGRCAATAGWRRSSWPPAGTPPRARPPRSASSLGLPERVLDQPLHTLSGGQRRRVELARILFSSTGADGPCCSTSPPTTSTPTRSPGCATTSRPTRAAWWSSATTSACSSTRVNRVFHLDANRAEIDVYNVGWKAYLQQRETDERRRKRERANAEKQAAVLKAQADRMRYKATKARAAQSMDKRAERLLVRPGRGAPATTGSPSCASRTRRRAARPR